MPPGWRPARRLTHTLTLCAHLQWLPSALSAGFEATSRFSRVGELSNAESESVRVNRAVPLGPRGSPQPRAPPAPPQHTAPLRPRSDRTLPGPGVRALGRSWLLPPPWQAALRLAAPPDLLHLGPLDVLHVGLDHLGTTRPRERCPPAPLLLSGLRQRSRQGAGARRQPRGAHGPPVPQGRPGKTEGGQAGHPPPCAAGAARCTPSSSPTPAPLAGKLEDTSHPPLQVTACSRLACRGQRAADKRMSGAHPGDTSRWALSTLDPAARGPAGETRTGLSQQAAPRYGWNPRAC